MSQANDRILQAARRLAQSGLPFSMDQVALGAGVSRASLYRHFPSRDALVAQLRAAGVSADELPKAVQERILETTGQVLAREGLAGLTLAAIATQAGVSLATLHRHFRGRAGLLQAFAEAQGVRQRARALALEDDGEPIELALTRFATHALQALRRSGPVLQLLLSASAGEQAQLMDARGPAEGTVHALTVYFRAQQRRGVLDRRGRPAVWATLFATQLVAHALVAPTLKLSVGRTDRAVAKALTQLFLEGARG